MTKSPKYFFDNEAIKEETLTYDESERDRDVSKLNNTPGRTRMAGLTTNQYEKRNKRSVWTITTKPFAEAHFATFPEDLIVPMIKAGCPKEVCKKCGKARERILISENPERTKKTGTGQDTEIGTKGRAGNPIVKEIGLTDCGCGEGFSAGLVLDPFMGAGTTGLVAKKLQRNFLGIELNPEYIKIAEKRINSINPMF